MIEGPCLASNRFGKAMYHLGIHLARGRKPRHRLEEEHFDVAHETTPKHLRNGPTG